MLDAMASPEVLRMRRDLATPLGHPVWPQGVVLAPFHPGRAGELHALLVLAYRGGAGLVDELTRWWPALSEDSDYDQDLCLLAVDGGGALVGAAQCWKSGFLKDLVVRPDWQRRGVGRALLLHLFATLRARGVASVELKVHADNPAGRGLYEQVGMVVS
jgi:ribosomal protein S18 acetylase RimI-like enzyme